MWPLHPVNSVPCKYQAFLSGPVWSYVISLYLQHVHDAVRVALTSAQIQKAVHETENLYMLYLLMSARLAWSEV